MDQNHLKQATNRTSAMRWRVAMFSVIGFMTMILFQNCDGGFHYDPTSGDLSAASTGGVGSTAFRLTTYSPAGLVIPEGQTFEGGVDFKIVATGQQVPTATILWALLNNTGGCVLKAGTGPETRFVNCVQSGRVTIQSTAIWTDGTTTVLASDRTTSPLIIDACGVSNANRTVFRIPNGTGTGAWNTAAAPVGMPIGMTLRICNDDSVSHQLMTTGGSPCASQAAPMAKGAFYECVIANGNNTNATTGAFNGMYDAIAGTSAVFYVRPYNGVALYADTTKSSNGQSCVSCHNAFANSEKKGASATAISSAIANNSGGMGIYNGRLTADELKALSFSLNQ